MTSTDPATYVHRPAPRWVIWLCVLLVLVTSLPAFIFNPSTLTTIGGIFGLLLMLGFVALLLAIGTRRVVITVDTARGQLSLRRVRAPLRDRVVAVALANITDLVFEPSTGARGVAYRLVLKLKEGADVPLTQSFYGMSAALERDRVAIRRLCGLN